MNCIPGSMMHSVLLLVATAFMLMPGVATAQTEGAEHGSHAGAHHPHANVIALFVGAAFEGSRDEGLALGVEYERRLSERWGIGALAEYTAGDIDAWVFGVPLAFHEGPWKLYAAPGIEDGEHGTEALIRVGVEYGFHQGRWEISPQFDIDFVDGEEIYVVGVTFGWGF